MPAMSASKVERGVLLKAEFAVPNYDEPILEKPGVFGLGRCAVNFGSTSNSTVKSFSTEAGCILKSIPS
jgi:hypothetical protein